MQKKKIVKIEQKKVQLQSFHTTRIRTTRGSALFPSLERKIGEFMPFNIPQSGL